MQTARYWWRRGVWGMSLAALGVMLLVVDAGMARQDKKKGDKGDAKELKTEASTKETAPPTPPKSRFMWFYEAEGIFFWPQLGISIAMVALIGSNCAAMRKAGFFADTFVQQFEALVKSRQFKEAYDTAKQNRSALGRMLHGGLSRINDGYTDALAGMQEAAEEEVMRHEHQLSYLAMIANIATLVGLLGTVWGMVGSFIVISESDTTPKPSELAQGVSQALTTTIWGLLTAIPAIIAFTILKNLLAKRTFQLGGLGEQLLKPFKNVTAKKPTVTEANPPAVANA